MTFHLYIYSVNICKAILNAKTDFNQQEKGLNSCASKNSCAYAHQPINRCIKHDALNAMILMLQNPTWTLFYFSPGLSMEILIFSFPGIYLLSIWWHSVSSLTSILKLPLIICISHSSKASVLQCSAFFVVQFSHPYMTTGKTTALTRWIFVGKVSLCFLICCLGLS